MEFHFPLEVQAGFEPADKGVADSPNKFGLIPQKPLRYLCFFIPLNKHFLLYVVTNVVTDVVLSNILDSIILHLIRKCKHL